jgi:hypothetical protein
MRDPHRQSRSTQRPRISARHRHLASRRTTAGMERQRDGEERRNPARQHRDPPPIHFLKLVSKLKFPQACQPSVQRGDQRGRVRARTAAQKTDQPSAQVLADSKVSVIDLKANPPAVSPRWKPCRRTGVPSTAPAPPALVANRNGHRVGIHHPRQDRPPAGKEARRRSRARATQSLLPTARTRS